MLDGVSCCVCVFVCFVCVYVLFFNLSKFLVLYALLNRETKKFIHVWLTVPFLLLKLTH